jgi:hypothetical protein
MSAVGSTALKTLGKFNSTGSRPSRPSRTAIEYRYDRKERITGKLDAPGNPRTGNFQ